MTARYPLVRVGADISELPAGDTLIGASSYTLPVATTTVLGGVIADGTSITVDGTGKITANLASSTSQIKQLVKNNTGVTLLKGQAVYINGATGVNVTVALARANTEATSSKTLGLIEADILNGNTGYVITEGELTNFDTSNAITEGDSVWLSPTTAGGLVYGLANKPVAPNHVVYLGVVSRKNVSNGAILVKVQNGYELDELHNVLITTPANGHVLKYDSVTSLWKNDVITYSELNGTVPTWNQNTTGNAATVTNGIYTTGSYSNPTWLTGLALSKISGLGTNVSTFLATPSSANLLTSMIDETGTGLLVFGTTPTLTGIIETKVSLAENNINLATGNYFTKTISTATVFTVSSVATSGLVSSFILDLTNGGSASITWWSGVKWTLGVAPSLTASGRDLLGFFTHDGGTTWNGLVLSKDVR